MDQKSTISQFPNPTIFKKNRVNMSSEDTKQLQRDSRPNISSQRNSANTKDINAQFQIKKSIIHQSHSSSIIKSLDFFKGCKDQQQERNSLKAFNFVKNRSYNPLVDEPEVVNFIIESIKQSGKLDKENVQIQRDRKQIGITRILMEGKKSKTENRKRIKDHQTQSLTNSPFRSPRNSHLSKIKFDPQRRNVQKLNEWLNAKMRQQKQTEKQSGSLITERIHALHFAFAQACRQAGKYSEQIASTLTNIHSEYHLMYEQLINCLMRQNLAVKSKRDELQQKINSIINHYEHQLLNVRTEYDKKSSKVIQNFHRCINIKQSLQNQNKGLIKLLQNERGKLKFMQEGLARSIQILLEIGDNKFKFLNPEQEKAIKSLSSEFRNIPDHYRLFHKWCGTMLRMIANIKQDNIQAKKTKEKEKEKQKQHSEEQVQYLKKFALSSIGKFMIDFDSNLSVNDAEQILLDFNTHRLSASSQPKKEAQNTEQAQNENENIKDNKELINIFEYHQKMQNQKHMEQSMENKVNQQKKTKKPAVSLIVPNLHQISQKFKGVNTEVQTSGSIEAQSKCVQTLTLELRDYGVVAKPKILSKDTTTHYWNKQKLSINKQSSMNIFLWGERDPATINKPQKSSREKSNKSSKQSVKEAVPRKMSIISSISTITKKGSKPQNSEKMDNQQKEQATSNKKLQKQGSAKSLKSSENLLNIVDEMQELKQRRGTDTIKDNQQSQNIEKGQTSLKRALALTRKEKNSAKKVLFAPQKKHQNSRQNSRQNDMTSIKQIDMNSSNEIAGEQTRNYSRALSISIKEEENDQGFDNDEDAEEQPNLFTYRQIKSLNLIKGNEDWLKKNKKMWLNLELDMYLEDILTKRTKRSKKLMLQHYKNMNIDFKQKNSTKKIGLYGHMMISNPRSMKKIFNINSSKNLTNLKNHSSKLQGKEKVLLELIRQPKKRGKQQNTTQTAIQSIQFNIHTHFFMVELVELLQEKNKKITESVMWNFKKTIQIQKLAQRLYVSKERVIPTANNLETIINCITHHIQPIISSYLKMYAYQMQAENALSPHEMKKQMLIGKKICYYHRLAPLMYLLINIMSLNSSGVGKCTKNATVFYRGLKNLRNFDKRFQIYEQIIDGQTIQLDVFVKIIYFMSESRSIDIDNQYVQMSVVQLQLFFILESYMTPSEIHSLLAQIKVGKKDIIYENQTKQNSKKSESDNICSSGLVPGEDKISLHVLALTILKAVSQKKSNLLKKYKNLLQTLISQRQLISYNDLVYFIEALPTDKKTRRKLLHQSSFYLVYWERKYPIIPTERLIFLFQSCRFLPNQVLQQNLIIEYFKLRCEKEHSQILEKITNNPEYVIQSVYQLLYRVPKMIYKLTQQIKTSKGGSKDSIYVLTMLYNMIIEDALQKTYVSGYLNALAAIPIPI